MAILGYHKVGPPRGGWWTWSYVPESTFSAQVRSLLEGGWAPIDLTTLLLGLETPSILPERSMLVTFDDGYRSFSRTALPLLDALGCPSVLFVPTDFVGGENGFDTGIEPSEPICDWSDLQALECAGVSIQSHGCSHRPLSTLSPDQLRDEVFRSKALLEERLEKAITAFSYPYGDAGSPGGGLSALLEEAGYRAACTYPGGLVSIGTSDRFRLQRLAMGPDTDVALLLDGLEHRPPPPVQDRT